MPNNPGRHASLFARTTVKLPEIYLVVALLVCAALSLLTPPLWTPDEFTHIQRELELSRSDWIARRTAQGVGSDIDVNYLQLADAVGSIQHSLAERAPSSSPPGSLVTEAQLAPLRQIRWAHRVRFSSFQNTAVYPPALYLPQAIALRLGEALGLTIVHTLLLARATAALCAIGLGWFALRLSGRGRWLIFAYLLIPTLLNLNASCSQDAILLAAPALVMVLISRAIAAGRLLSTSELVVASVTLAACIGARSPYLPLAMMLLLPNLEVATPLSLRRSVAPMLAVALVIAINAVWQLLVHPLGIFSSPTAHPAAQTALMRSHPLEAMLHVGTGTFLSLPNLLIKGMGLLGQNDVFPPHALYGALLVALAGVGWFAPPEGLKQVRSRVVVGVVLLSIVAGMSLAEYVIWTPVGVAHVDGLQSRYYLPLLPFAFFLWPRTPATRKGTLFFLDDGAREQATLFFGAVLVCVVLSMPWVAANRFYKIGLGAALRASVRP